MDVYVSGDGDSIGARVGLAVLSDDVSEVRRVDQSIQQGNELWRSFALRVGGSVIEMGGDEFRIQIGADHLGELPDIARQYSEVVGATVTVGVGMKLSESARALMYGKLTGKNKICIWDAEAMQPIIDEATKHPKSEKDKLAEEYLNKADAPGTTGATANDEHAGFTGSSTGSEKKGTQGDHEEGAVAGKAVQDAQDNAPAAPEMTHAAEDFEAQLHDAAQEQSQKDQDGKVEESGRVEQIKQQVADTLTRIRAQMPVLVQIRQTAPETYAAIMGLVQGVIALGREVMTGAEVPADTEPSHVQEAVRKAESARPFVPEAEFNEATADNPQYLKNYLQPGWKERVSMVDPKTTADALDWKYHPSFDVSQMNPSGFKADLDNERKEAVDDGYHTGPGDPYEHFKDWLKTPHRQPIVLFHTAEGKLEPADGSHRLGYAAEQGVTHLPAIVGHRPLGKSVSEIDSGKRAIEGPGRLSFDYSHVLPKGAADQGLTMKVIHSSGKETNPPSQTPSARAAGERILAEIHHGDKRVGQVTAYVDRDDPHGANIEPHSFLDENYRGKGLGTAMYEAAYAHAKNKLGISTVYGGSHSAMASALHQRLAQKHGFGYYAAEEQDPVVRNMGYTKTPYAYTIKDELPAESDEEILGGKPIVFQRSEELDKGGVGSEGGAEAGRAHLKLPVGTEFDGKIKIKNPETGKAGWKSVEAGAIQSQKPGAPLLGANSYPVSSRNPGG